MASISSISINAIEKDLLSNEKTFYFTKDNQGDGVAIAERDLR